MNVKKELIAQDNSLGQSNLEKQPIYQNENFDDLSVVDLEKDQEQIREEDAINLEKIRKSFNVFNPDFEKSVKNEKIDQEDKEFSEDKIKEGVDFIFEQRPELKTVGTKEQYLMYIKNIFPQSKIKRILYHGSYKNDIDSFVPGKLDIGIHFGTLEAAKYRGEKSEYYKIYPVLANALKTKETPDLLMFNQHNVFDYLLTEGIVKEGDRKYLDTLFNTEPSNNYRDNGGDAMFEYLQNKMEVDSLKYINKVEDKGNFSYIIFNPSNIHILGSNQDLEEFKKFNEVENKT